MKGHITLLFLAAVLFLLGDAHAATSRTTPFYPQMFIGLNSKFGNVFDTAYDPRQVNNRDEMGRVAVSINGRNTLNLFSVKDAETAYYLGNAMGDVVTAISYSPDGNAVIAGSSGRMDGSKNTGGVYIYTYSSNGGIELASSFVDLTPDLTRLGDAVSTINYGHFAFITGKSLQYGGYAVAIVNQTTQSIPYADNYLDTIYPDPSSSLAVRESFGSSLSSFASDFFTTDSFILLQIGISAYELDGKSCGAFSTYLVNGTGFTASDTYTPQDCTGGQRFGESMHISPRSDIRDAPITLAVGAPGDNEGVGAVYIYLVNADTYQYTFEAKVTPSGIQNAPLSLSSSFLSSPSRGDIGDEEEGEEEEEREVDPLSKGQFGYGVGVSVNGQQVAIGAPYLNDKSGGVWVVVREEADSPNTATTWKYLNRILVDLPLVESMFGSGVRFLGDTFLYISAPLDRSKGNAAGMMYQAAATCPGGYYAWGTDDLCTACPAVRFEYPLRLSHILSSSLSLSFSLSMSLFISLSLYLSLYLSLSLFPSLSLSH